MELGTFGKAPRVLSLECFDPNAVLFFMAGGTKGYEVFRRAMSTAHTSRNRMCSLHISV